MKKVIYWTLIVAIATAGCIGEDTSRCNVSGPAELRLGARIENNLQVRTPFDDSENLTARVLASHLQGNYERTYADGIMAFVCNGSSKAHYQPFGFKGNRYFPDNNNDIIHFTGLYPANDWELRSSQALYRIDGKTDLMATAEVNTRRTDVQQNPANYPVLTFKKLLTKLLIVIKTGDNKANLKWGEITKIELVGAKGGLLSTASVHLETGAASFGIPVDNIPCYIMSGVDGEEIYTNTEFANQQLPVSSPAASTYKAYTLVAPVTAGGTGNDYTFRIYTTKAENSFVTVGISLKDNEGNPFQGNTAGKTFIVTLSFE